MLFSPIAWVMLTLTLLVTLPGALAASTPKRSKKTATQKIPHENYPALEEGEVTELTAEAARPASPALAPRPAPRVQTLGAITLKTKFELVPVEKRHQILKRMQLCQSLFEESGRAYDYRSMTTAELANELAAIRKLNSGRVTLSAGEPEVLPAVKDTDFDADSESI